MELKNYCIIRSNRDIKDLLFKRFYELNMTLTDVVNDARKHGLKSLTVPALSRYMKLTRSPMKGVKQSDVLFLCKRYCINVDLIVREEEYDREKGVKSCKLFIKKISNESDKTEKE